MVLVLQVAPYTGAWIEILMSIGADCAGGVASYTGAWIEIALYPVMDEP